MELDKAEISESLVSGHKTPLSLLVLEIYMVITVGLIIGTFLCNYFDIKLFPVTSILADACEAF